LGRPSVGVFGRCGVGFRIGVEAYVQLFIDITPTISETLENLEKISQVTQQPIEKMSILVPTTENPSHYQELVTALVVIFWCFDVKM
jgi:hypothetical protein